MPLHKLHMRLTIPPKCKIKIAESTATTTSMMLTESILNFSSILPKQCRYRDLQLPLSNPNLKGTRILFQLQRDSDYRKY